MFHDGFVHGILLVGFHLDMDFFGKDVACPPNTGLSQSTLETIVPLLIIIRIFQCNYNSLAGVSERSTVNPHGWGQAVNGGR